MLRCDGGGAVNLYFNGGSPKLATASHGVVITGFATATTFSGSGASLTSLNATNLASGTIPNGRFPTTLPAVSGANLTSLNASEITSGTLPIARITDGAVTFAKMQDVGTGVFIGRDSSGTGDIETLTAAEARTLLNVADGATAGITTASTNVTATWSITASDSNGYEFTGPGQDGSEDDPDIYLVRGHKYRFVNTTGSSHPFEFRNSANDADYTDGITGSQSGTQEFNVQHDAPAALKYRCTIHTGNMLGNIYIVGQHLTSGANNRVLTATSAYGMNGESALTFDGETLTISAPSNDTPFIVDTASTNGAHLRFQKDGTNQHFVGAGGGFSLGDREDLSMRAYDNLLFSTGNSSTEKLRIDSAGKITTNTTGTIIADYNSSNSGGAYVQYDIGANGANIGYIGAASHLVSGAATADLGIRSTQNFVISTGGASERLRITSDGNINVNSAGVSSPYSSFRHISINNNLVLNAANSAGGFAGMQHNAYLNSSGNWVRINNDHATSIGTDDGNFYIRNTGAGTGNISWNMPVKIHASNRINIGEGNSGSALGAVHINTSSVMGTDTALWIGDNGNKRYMAINQVSNSEMFSHMKLQFNFS